MLHYIIGQGQRRLCGGSYQPTFVRRFLSVARYRLYAVPTARSAIFTPC